MAEESFQEKTEQATPKRREESRRKGQVARSAELSSLAILVSGLLAMVSLSSYVYNNLTGFMVSMFTDGFSVQLNALNLPTYLMTWAASYVRIVLPFVALLVAAALAINYAQVGVIFTVTVQVPGWCGQEREEPGGLTATLRCLGVEAKGLAGGRGRRNKPW